MNRKVALGFAALTVGLIYNTCKVRKLTSRLDTTIDVLDGLLDISYQESVDKIFSEMTDDMED